MVSREMDGYLVESTAVQGEPGGRGYQPAVIVRKIGGEQLQMFVLDTFQLAQMSEGDANAFAEHYVANRLLGVTPEGPVWVE